MPTGTASRSAPPPAPGRTPPEPLPPVQTKGQSSSARRAVCPGLFLLPIFPPLALLPARCTGSPAGSVRIGDGPARSMTPPAPRRRNSSPRPPPPPPPSPPPPTPAAAPPPRPPLGQHIRSQCRVGSLHTLPDLTAASSPPPAPTDTTPRQPCRPPAAADHPANSQKPPTAARRRRGQILYLTGIWPLQYSQ